MAPIPWYSGDRSDWSVRTPAAETTTRAVRDPSGPVARPTEVVGSRMRCGRYAEPSGRNPGIGNGCAAGQTSASVRVAGPAGVGGRRSGDGSASSTATRTRADPTATAPYHRPIRTVWRA
ncbi:MAG: hypothetical protein AUI14_17470 [Actinobacteria bacterium 13_2_20CM_2_71_6]|nr:MAG: hypothetical protein AUI14_17470 [Actinobacteria bacterium 13_2_20CM_2_71_6]